MTPDRKQDESRFLGGTPPEPTGVRRRSETVRRSVMKAISYRLMSSVLTIGISYSVTGVHSLAISIGVLDLVVKLLGYYLHERAWIWADRRLGTRAVVRSAPPRA